MFAFLLVVHAIIAAALVTVILMQRSEGGGLGMGGSPSGLMSARGAADFLTRATTVLASAFVGLSIVLAVIASSHRTASVDTSLKGSGFAKPPVADAVAPPPGANADPFASAAQNAAAAANASGSAARGLPADNGAVPLAR
jgi:preprotein translocase subunit SecG